MQECKLKLLRLLIDQQLLDMKHPLERILFSLLNRLTKVMSVTDLLEMVKRRTFPSLVNLGIINTYLST